MSPCQPESSNFASQEDAQAFEAEGIRLWQQVQKELTPDYQVFYFSEQQHQLLNPNYLAKITV